jgi:transcriptional regulator with XRE-family HTH domain
LKDIESLPPDKVEQTYKIIGDNVRKARKNKKVSQLKLSLAMGYNSVSVVSCAELYHRKIHFNIEHLIKIAHILEVDIKDFFEGVEI